MGLPEASGSARFHAQRPAHHIPVLRAQTNALTGHSPGVPAGPKVQGLNFRSGLFGSLFEQFHQMVMRYICSMFYPSYVSGCRGFCLAAVDPYSAWCSEPLSLTGNRLKLKSAPVEHLLKPHFVSGAHREFRNCCLCVNAGMVTEIFQRLLICSRQSLRPN